MGHRDLVVLYKVVQEARRLSDHFNFGFVFEWDQGSYETRIDINEDGAVFKGNGKLPLIGYTMFCPDILDFENKIIIEWDEEFTKNKKGHNELGKRDARRFTFYSNAKFSFLILTESDKNWKQSLKAFLIETYAKKQLKSLRA